MLMDPAGFAASLALAFTASLHCAGMCGPFAAASVPPPSPARRVGVVATSLGLYNLGKLTSYLLLGGAALWLGASARSLGPWPARALSILSGGLLIALGARAAGLLPRPSSSFVSGGAVGRGWAQIGARLLELPGAARPLLLGAFSGLLPCPLVYAFAARAAAAAAPLDGLATMLALALGTAPALGAVTLASTGLWQKRLALARAWGFAVVALGCWTLARAWTPLPCCHVP